MASTAGSNLAREINSLFAGFCSDKALTQGRFTQYQLEQDS